MSDILKKESKWKMERKWGFADGGGGGGGGRAFSCVYSIPRLYNIEWC